MFDKNNSFGNVTINGQTITCSGRDITISNGNVIVDGNVIQTNIGNNAKIIINGDVNKIDCIGSVEVHGNSESIDCGGNCTVYGDVNGNIDVGGSIECDSVLGDIVAGGSVRCKRKDTIKTKCPSNCLRIIGQDLCGYSFRYNMSIGGLSENDIDVKSFALGFLSVKTGQVLHPSDIIVEVY